MRDRRRSCLVVVVVAEGEARGGDDEVRDDAREKRCVAAESMGSGGQWQPVRTQSRSRGRGRGARGDPRGGATTRLNVDLALLTRHRGTLRLVYPPCSTRGSTRSSTATINATVLPSPPSSRPTPLRPARNTSDTPSRSVPAPSLCPCSSSQSTDPLARAPQSNPNLRPATYSTLARSTFADSRPLADFVAAVLLYTRDAPLGTSPAALDRQYALLEDCFKCASSSSSFPSLSLSQMADPVHVRRRTADRLFAQGDTGWFVPTLRKYARRLVDVALAVRSPLSLSHSFLCAPPDLSLYPTGRKGNGRRQAHPRRRGGAHARAAHGRRCQRPVRPRLPSPPCLPSRTPVTHSISLAPLAARPTRPRSATPSSSSPTRPSASTLPCPTCACATRSSTTRRTRPSRASRRSPRATAARSCTTAGGSRCTRGGCRRRGTT